MTSLYLCHRVCLMLSCVSPALQGGDFLFLLSQTASQLAGQNAQI